MVHHPFFRALPLCRLNRCLRGSSECSPSQSLVDDAVKKGARVLAGGFVPTKGSRLAAGQFYPPTVLVDVTTDMLIMQVWLLSSAVIRFLLPICAFKADTYRMSNTTLPYLSSRVSKADSMLWHCLFQEEIFGPIMCVTRIVGNSDDEAIRIANDCSFGLSSCAFSASKKRAGDICR